MEKNEYDFVKNIENIPDRSVITTIKGISRRIEYIIQKEDLDLETKSELLKKLEITLGVFEVEAEKRGLSYE